MYSEETIFPFAQQGNSSQPQSFPYDVVINEAFPGVQFQPTEPSGVYSVIREVSGCLWFVNNADYNTSTLEWTQENSSNAALPAYAFELCANGTFNRYFGAATTIPGNPISWQLVYEIDANGSVISTPPTVTASGDAAQQVTVTWNAGTSTSLYARRVDITNTSSASNSVLDQLSVNGTVVWQVDRSGILQVGEIPFARITGYTPPSFNNPTFTGTATFSGPVDANDGIIVTGAPAMIEDGLTVTSGPTLLDGGLTVTGGTTTDNLTVTGTATLPSSAFPVDSIVGADGVSVTHTGNAYTVSGGALVETIESTDSSVNVTTTGQTVNLSIANAKPVYGLAFATATNFAVGTTTGSLTLGPLPGTGATTYLLICSGSLQFQDASKVLTLTGSGTGVTWPNSPQNYQNSQAGSFPFTFYGTTTGGKSATVTWSCNDSLGYTPMTMVITAYAQT